MAVSNGHLDCVRFLRERAHFPWDEGTTSRASIHGQLDVLVYLHTEGCPWDETAYPRPALVKWDPRPTATWACVRYLLAHGCPCAPELRAELLKNLVRQVLLPTWRSRVRWMIKVRPYAWHCFHELQRITCAPNGAGRKRDRKEWETDSAMPHAAQ